METKDFICACLGINSAKVDEICDNFDIDIKQDDIERILRISHDDYSLFGDKLILDLYLRIIKKAIKEFSLPLARFDYFTNGQDSHLYYDKQEVYGWGDLEYISKTIKE